MMRCVCLCVCAGMFVHVCFSPDLLSDREALVVKLLDKLASHLVRVVWSGVSAFLL